MARGRRATFLIGVAVESASHGGSVLHEAADHFSHDRGLGSQKRIAARLRSQKQIAIGVDSASETKVCTIRKVEVAVGKDTELKHGNLGDLDVPRNVGGSIRRPRRVDSHRHRQDERGQAIVGT